MKNVGSMWSQSVMFLETLYAVWLAGLGSGSRHI